MSREKPLFWGLFLMKLPTSGLESLLDRAHGFSCEICETLVENRLHFIGFIGYYSNLKYHMKIPLSLGFFGVV